MLFARASTLAIGLLSSTLVSAQTFSKCNPLKQQCPADPALGTSKSIDFTAGQSSDFTATGNSITYGSNGAEMTVAKSGDAPLLVSNWYLMFGRVDIVMKASTGVGMVSSAILESDDLDEIDWEMLGYQPDQVQTNYFGKGQTGSYDRGGTSANAGSSTTFKTYTIEWTSNQIVWSIDGQTTRILQASQANGQFPQTPMRIKLGPWAGGDSSNQPGVQSWAGGAINYSNGPFKMYVKSVAAKDYSTGKSYSYSGTDGTWQQVKAEGGSVSGGPSSIDTSGTPQVSSTSGQPVPFAGTHAEPSSTFSTPSVYPWVSAPSTFSSVSSGAPTSIPGLPAGWSVSSSGKVVPPSSAPSSYPGASSTPPSQPSGSASPSASPVNAGAPLAGGAQSPASGSSLITPAPPGPTATGGSPIGASNGTLSSSVRTLSSSASQPAFTGAAARAGSGIGAGLAALALGALAL